MYQKKIDGKLKSLESLIDEMCGKLLHIDIPAIEHKPRNMPLLLLPREQDVEETENAA